MVEELVIDLFDAPIDILAHGCNCQNVFGSGVALQVKETFPEAYEEYIQTKKGDSTKLGNIQLVKVADSGIQWVCNMFTQDSFGYDGKKYTNLEALWCCLEKLSTIANTNLVIGIPYKLCSDRGGAPWSVVLAMINHFFADSPRKLLICKKP